MSFLPNLNDAIVLIIYLINMTKFCETFDNELWVKKLCKKPRLVSLLAILIPLSLIIFLEIGIYFAVKHAQYITLVISSVLFSIYLIFLAFVNIAE